jgi:hypothetical protein
MDEGVRSVSINNKFLKKLTKKNGIMESVAQTKNVKYKENDVVLLKDGREGTILHEIENDHGDMVYLVEIEGLDCESWPYVTEAGIEKVIYPS